MPLEQKAREPSMQAAWPWAQADWPVRVEKRELRSLASATLWANSVGVTVDVGEGMSVTMVGISATGLEPAADDAGGLEMGALRTSVGEVWMAVEDGRVELEGGDEVIGRVRVEAKEREDDGMLSGAVGAKGFVVTLKRSPGTKVTTVVVGFLSRTLLLLLGSVPFRLAI